MIAGFRGLSISTLLVSCTLGFGQAASQPQKVAADNPTTRLQSARNVIIRKARSSAEIPYNVVSTSIEGWGRFNLVDAPEKADLIIDVNATGDNEIVVTSSDAPSPRTGQMEHTNSSRKDVSLQEVKLTVIDAKNNRVLWSATEQVKYAVKEKARENNLVEASEHLVLKLHDRLEPPPPATATASH